MASRRKKKERQKLEAERQEQEAKQKKRAKIAGRIMLGILVIVDLVLLGAGINYLKTEYELKKSCTAEAVGYVTDVKVTTRTSRSRSGRPTTVRTYHTYIEVNDSKCPVHEIYIEKGGFKEGANVKVYYDPDGYSYYVEGGPKDNIIIGSVLTALGVLMLVFKGWLVYMLRFRKKPEDKKDEAGKKDKQSI
ncbi:hypothetical protein [uncultured Ruminococcus sp.]|uniref:hypothetical protein n=1 Tax=uncultured Ruminococcus sp. TaxID=165186 RepID=UPI000EE2AD6F|nr:hypothetical protein [uncultured Ruminococcus sp.]HCJ40442.1 hypothetical protein [Ruminococcus sp.]